MSSHDRYENPLISRYASEPMAQLWGDQRKFSTWRRLWIALAEAEQELGLPITDAQLAELRAHIDDIDFAAHLEPPLTTMHVDKIAMGRIAVQMLENRLAYPGSEQVSTVLRPRLIERESVAAIS